MNQKLSSFFIPVHYLVGFLMVFTLISERCGASEVLAQGFTPYKGSDSCREWLYQRIGKHDRAPILEAYALGYMYAYNSYYAPKHGLGHNWSKVDFFKFVDDECKLHIDASISAVVADVLQVEIEKK